MKKKLVYHLIITLLVLFSIFSNVSFAAGDSAPPILENIEITSKVVGVGEKLTVQAKITDDVSGVKRAQLNFSITQGHVTKENIISLHYNEEKQLWIGEDLISDQDLRGAWQIDSYHIEDRAGNIVFKSRYEIPNYLDYYYIVDNPNEVDIISPLVEEIKVSPKVVKVGEEITIQIKASDANEIVHFQTDFEIEDPYTRGFYKEIQFNYDKQTGFWIGKYKILPNDFKGFWKLKSLVVGDRNQNYTRVAPMELPNKEKYIVEVINPGSDLEPPTIESIEITPREVTTNEVVTIKAKASDPSGVDHIHVSISPPSRNSERVITLFDKNQDGIWEGTYKVTKFDERGKWVVSAIIAYDRSNNGRLYLPNEFVNYADLTMMIIEDRKAPISPKINPVSDQSKFIMGTSEPEATVIVQIGTSKFETKANKDGVFNLSIPQQPADTKLSVTATDDNGNVSELTYVTVVDKTPPVTPKVNPVADYNRLVKGTAEPNAKLKLTIGSTVYHGLSDHAGSFKITIPSQKANTKLKIEASDASGNVSEAAIVTVIDKTPPAVPKVNVVKTHTTVMTGKSEAHAVITVKVGNSLIGTATSDKNGNFKVKIKKQKKNTVLSVIAKDRANNVSKVKIVKVQ
jgi:hypothetical protein